MPAATNETISLKIDQLHQVARAAAVDPDDRDTADQLRVAAATADYHLTPELRIKMLEAASMMDGT